MRCLFCSPSVPTTGGPHSSHERHHTVIIWLCTAHSAITMHPARLTVAAIVSCVDKYSISYNPSMTRARVRHITGGDHQPGRFGATGCTLFTGKSFQQCKILAYFTHFLATIYSHIVSCVSCPCHSFSLMQNAQWLSLGPQTFSAQGLSRYRIQPCVHWAHLNGKQDQDWINWWILNWKMKLNKYEFKIYYYTW